MSNKRRDLLYDALVTSHVDNSTVSSRLAIRSKCRLSTLPQHKDIVKTPARVIRTDQNTYNPSMPSTITSPPCAFSSYTSFISRYFPLKHSNDCHMYHLNTFHISRSNEYAPFLRNHHIHTTVRTVEVMTLVHLLV